MKAVHPPCAATSPDASAAFPGFETLQTRFPTGNKPLSLPVFSSLIGEPLVGGGSSLKSSFLQSPQRLLKISMAIVDNHIIHSEPDVPPFHYPPEIRQRAAPPEVY